MSQHTPGPWRADDNGDGTHCITSGRGRDVADTRSSSDEKANASLLTAAPDLYALALAYETWEADLILCQEAWDGGWADLPKLTEELWDRLLKIQAMRNAAVAKARGLKW